MVEVVSTAVASTAVADTGNSALADNAMLMTRWRNNL
jgi:hypothetical protein